jgi:hypothetical protein
MQQLRQMEELRGAHVYVTQLEVSQFNGMGVLGTRPITSFVHLHALGPASTTTIKRCKHVDNLGQQQAGVQRPLLSIHRVSPINRCFPWIRNLLDIYNMLKPVKRKGTSKPQPPHKIQSKVSLDREPNTSSTASENNIA